MSSRKLDIPYMEKNLKVLLRDIAYYTPDEMMLALQRLSLVAADQAGHTVTIKTKYDTQKEG